MPPTHTPTHTHTHTHTHIHPHTHIQPLTVLQIKQVQKLIEERNEKAKEEIKVCEEERHRYLVLIGNIVHPSVPVSNDEVCVCVCVCAHACRWPGCGVDGIVKSLM